MRRRIIALCIIMLLCIACVLNASAAPTSLLIPAQTRLTSAVGAFVYAEDGTLTVTSADENGVTAAIDLNMTVNVYETPFERL